MNTHSFVVRELRNWYKYWSEIIQRGDHFEEQEKMS